MQQGVFPGGELCFGHSRTGLQAHFPQNGRRPRSLSGGEGGGVGKPDKLLCPEQKRQEHRQPGPEPGPAQQRAHPEVQSLLFAHPQPYPVSAGQSSKARILPGGTVAAEAPGQSRHAVEMQPGPGGSGEQGLGAAAACSELHCGPKPYRFHGGTSYSSAKSVRRKRPRRVRRVAVRVMIFSSSP